MPLLKSGVVSVKSLVGKEPAIDRVSGVKYIDCLLYQIKSLKQLFPGLKYEEIPLAGALLGNDYLLFTKCHKLIKKLPPVNENFSNVRHGQIFRVFHWLASHESRESVLAEIQEFCGNKSTPNHPVLEYITNHCSQLPESTALDSLPIDDYLSQNKCKLFLLEPNIPNWAYNQYLASQFDARLISITQIQFDVFPQITEDFDVWDSVYQAAFGLCKRIYGLLRSGDSEVKEVEQIGRRGTDRVEVMVDPEYIISNVLLPTISKVSSLSKSARIDFFFMILDLDPTLLSKINQIFPSTFQVSKAKKSQFVTLIISVIYLNRHLELPLWIEFLYSLLINLLFMGHFTTVESVPTVLQLDVKDHWKLLNKLKHFEFNVSKRGEKSKLPNYQPRITHFYNAFQVVMKNVLFLSQILDLSSVFNIDLLVSGLQGTFIYNLTMHLAKKDKPLFHLEEQLLGNVNLKLSSLFQQLLDCILQNSSRKYIVTKKDAEEAADSRNVVPAFVRVNRRVLKKGEQALVRGLKR